MTVRSPDADASVAIKLDPKNGAVFWNRGNVYKDLGEFNRAIEDYNLAIAINSKDFNAFNSRGRTYAAIGGHALALADFTQAITLAPSYVEAYDNRGLSLLDAGRRRDRRLPQGPVARLRRPDQPAAAAQLRRVKRCRYYDT